MRYADDAPSGVMEYLFVELMLWGAAAGLPLVQPRHGAARAASSSHRLAPLWNRLGALLFRHGEQFYNFQGLRAFKDKFDPVWEPRYLASPGGLAVPLVLADVAALISGGVTGVDRRAEPERERRALRAREDLRGERRVVAVEVVPALRSPIRSAPASAGARQRVSSSSSP